MMAYSTRSASVGATRAADRGGRSGSGIPISTAVSFATSAHIRWISFSTTRVRRKRR